MVQSRPITVLTEEQAESSSGAAGAVIGLDLEIRGRNLHLRLCAADSPARLSDIVKPAWTLSTMITDAVLENIRQEHGRIPCVGGCTACCRSLVPLAVPEMLQLSESIHMMPRTRRRTVQRSFLLAARRLLKTTPPTSFPPLAASDLSNCSVELEAVSGWYRGLKLHCPFQGKRNCTIYQDRPLACREHFVHGSAAGCAGDAGVAEVVDIPVRMVDALVYLTADLEKSDPDAVMMPLLPVWYERNAQRAEQTWPAILMAERLASIVRAMAADNSPVRVIGRN